MKFQVTRTSVWDNNIKPCEEAVQVKYNILETKAFRSPEEFDKKWGKKWGTWLSEGINHCINEKGYIQREFPERGIGWFIELNSFDELLNFINKYEKVVIEKSWDNPRIIQIEIYDDYRE